MAAIDRIAAPVEDFRTLDGVESAHVSCCFIVEDSGDAVEFIPEVLEKCSRLGLIYQARSLSGRLSFEPMEEEEILNIWKKISPQTKQRNLLPIKLLI